MTEQSLFVKTVVKEDGRVWGVGLDMRSLMDCRPGNIIVQHRLFTIELDDAIEASMEALS